MDEMIVFLYDENNKMKAQRGFYDDCIMAAAMAFQGFKVLSNKKLNQIDDGTYDELRIAP